MKIKFKENKILNKNTFPEVLQKALKNIDAYELSEFEFEREWQIAYLKYLEEVIDSIVKGLALKIDVDPTSIQKAFHIPILPLLKASNGDISGEALLLKSLWQKLKDKYTKSVNVFKKFFFNKGNPLKPMKIKGQIVYNPETKKDLTKGEWKDIEDSVIDYLGDTLNDPNEELAIRSGLFGLLRKKMDDQGKSIKEQKKTTYQALLDEYGYEINNPKEVYEKISKEDTMKASIEYAKKHGAEYLSIKNGEIKNKIVSMMRKQIVGGLEDGISAQEMISRLYWIDPSDELGKRFNEETVQSWNRDLRRIVRTEMSMATNNGYLAANQDSVKEGEKLYFVYSGQHNPKEKPNEPCNIYLGKVGLLMNTPQGDEETEDPEADYAIWYGKNNVGRKEPEWWFAIPTHPHCYSKDTEVYTENGWKLIKNVKTGEKCLSLNPDNKNIEFVNVIDTIKHKEKELIHFKNLTTDLMVTKNHKMFYQKDEARKEKTGKFIFKDAIDLLNKKSGRFYRGCDWKTKDKKINDLWYEFFGYYLSDGYVEKRSENSYLIGICRSKEKNKIKHEKIFKCVSKLFKDNYVSSEKDGIRFSNKKLGKYLKKFGKCNQKYIPSFIMNSQKEKIRVFLNAYLMCDGHQRSYENKLGFISTEKNYFTTSKKMADQITELMLKAGKSPGVYLDKNKGRVVKFKNGTYTCNYDLYRISENNHTYTGLHSIKKNIVPYNDYVYCVELEKYNTLWVRRNYKTLWSGNCTHFWQRIHPKFQQYDIDTDKIEYKEMEKSNDFSLDNVEWKNNKAKFVKEKLPEYIKKIKKELKINFPIIIRLYKQHKEGKSVRSVHDEGIIILYESSPDPILDCYHEIGHLYFHLMKVAENKKIINKLNSIKKHLETSKDFNRIFNNDHTYSNIKEIFATIFKWYISGKIIDKTYLDVLLQYLPGNDISFLNDLFMGNLKKAIDFSPTIAFDFDKVISEYNGWKGLTKFGAPIQSTIDLMQQYKDEGYKIIIFTTRPDNKAIRKYLKDHKVYYDQFIGDKPFYNCFIDDRTVNNLIHKNDLKQTIDKVLSFDDDLKKSMKFDLIKNDQTKLKMNYKGIPINIEWKKGETRSYPGSPWKNPMLRHSYGYVRNTDSPDGEDIDVYVHIPIKENAPIYILNQLHAGDKYAGEFDEHKFMIGYPSKKAAREAYIETMQKNMYGGMTKISVENFKKNVLPFYKK